ncbi:MAG: TnpV protein [Clostridia bacterium]|nr:TnpV protein [Clostridia bacterium]
MKTNNISYRRVGDYNIPNLVLLPKEANITLGKWGMLHKDYLKKHKTVLFNSLLIQGKLYKYCSEIETQARDMFYTIVDQLKKAEGVTEELKEKNQFVWIQKMSNIQQRAEEIVINELIYV